MVTRISFELKRQVRGAHINLPHIACLLDGGEVHGRLTPA
jgi:hypothetical protein